MKCPNCEEYDNCKLAWKDEKDLAFCTDYKQKQTNEEWFCQLSTEEKAEWVTKNLSVYADDWAKSDEKLLNPATWVDWLNEVHK